MGVRWLLRLLFTCVSLVARDIEHLLRGLWAIGVIFGEMCSGPLPIFKSGVLIFCRWLVGAL